MTKPKQLSTPLPANATIGIVGGGQLGRMLAIAAAKLGYQTVILEPGNNCPAAQVTNRQIVAAYDDQKGLEELAKACDVITYEFENVPLIAANFLDQIKPLSPPAQALEVAQDRVVEKQYLQQCGVETAPFIAVSGLEDLRSGLQKFGKGVLKTRRFGYDGKGQFVFNSRDSFEQEWLQKSFEAIGSGGGHGYILEDLVDFTSEFSVIAARGADGDVKIFEAASNIHENGILRRSVVPAHFESATASQQARDWVIKIMERLHYVGVIGVEFFQTDNGLLVNEIAPRVHNTGHWTVEACATCQFEQHIRAIAGLPLGNPELLVQSCEMDNLLGEEAEAVVALLKEERTHITLYGKTAARPGRKMGHVTRLGLKK